MRRQTRPVPARACTQAPCRQSLPGRKKRQEKTIDRSPPPVYIQTTVPVARLPGVIVCTSVPSHIIFLSLRSSVDAGLRSVHCESDENRRKDEPGTDQCLPGAVPGLRDDAQNARELCALEGGLLRLNGGSGTAGRPVFRLRPQIAPAACRARRTGRQPLRRDCHAL